MNPFRKLLTPAKTPMLQAAGEVATEKPGGKMGQTAVPYAIDRRPMPEGEDPELLLPRQVGPYSRKSIDVPQNLRHQSIDAYYRLPRRFALFRSKIYVQLGVCDDRNAALKALATAKAETNAEFPDNPQVFCDETDPSFFKTSDFMAWTRGRYYFSVYADGGEAELDAFMEAFPY
jgi:hypothetical protein